MAESGPQPPATPPPPGFPPPAPSEVPVAPVPTKKRRTPAIIIGSAAAVIAAMVTTGIVVVGATKGSTNDDDKPAVTAAASSVPDADVVSPVTESDPEPTYSEVDAESFSMELRTTARQCFGSAGCNVTVEPDLTYLGSGGDIDPDAVYEITYEIRGDESGPVIATAELTDQTSLSYRPSLISTASASTELSVEITDIQTGG